MSEEKRKKVSWTIEELEEEPERPKPKKGKSLGQRIIEDFKAKDLPYAKIRISGKDASNVAIGVGRYITTNNLPYESWSEGDSLIIRKLTDEEIKERRKERKKKA